LKFVLNSDLTRRKKHFQVKKLTSVKIGALYSILKQFETLQKQFGKVLEVCGELCPDATEKNFLVIKLTSVKVGALYSIGKQLETLQKQFGKVLEVWGNSAPTWRKKIFLVQSLVAWGYLPSKRL
jgi:hypothetical protein